MKVAIRKALVAAHHGVDAGPFLVADNVSRSSFDAWSSRIEACWRVALVISKGVGRVYLYGDPSSLHEAVCSWIHSSWVEQSVDAGCRFTTLVRDVRSTTQWFWDGCKGPDLSYTSMSARGQRTPRVVLEFAYKNEPMAGLIDEVKVWHERGVQLALGVKVEVKRCNRSGEVTLRLFYIQQGASDAEPTTIEFSPGVCSESNRDEFVKAFPFSTFTQDVEEAKDFQVQFSLFDLQQKIFEELILEADSNQVLYAAEDGILYLEERGSEMLSCPVCGMQYDPLQDQLWIQCDDALCHRWFHASCMGIGSENLPEHGVPWSCTSCSNGTLRACDM